MVERMKEGSEGSDPDEGPLTDEVSVIIPYSPSHTPEDLLEQAKVSVRSQTIDADIIVVRDAHGHGPAWARNQGLDQSSQRYVAFLDADDVWHEDKLDRQLLEMQRTGAGVCVEAEPMSESQFIRELYLGNIESIMSSVVIDTSRVDVRFDERLERREDHLFVLEAVAQAGFCQCTDLFSVGRHAGSLSAGTPTLYRLRQDYHFARRVSECVPGVADAIRDFYSVPRCDPQLPNTTGDVLRSAFLWPNFRSVLGVASSVLCQRLT